MPRPSLRHQQEQQFLGSYRQMNALDQRLVAACVELYARDGRAGLRRLRHALDVGLQARPTRKTRGQRRTPAGSA